MKTNQTLFLIKRRPLSTWCMAICAGIFALMVGAHGFAQESLKPGIAVMPFIKGKHPEKVEQTLICPYAGICFEQQDVQSGADETLTLMLHEILSNRLGNKVLPMDTVAAAYDTLKINYETDTPASFAQRLGKALGVKYIVTGNVWRYKNRTGEAFASSQPSSVAFAVYLINIEDNALIWTQTYDEYQQSLSENLLNAVDFFKQGAKWLTADEFAEYGLKKILKTFPDIP